DGVSANPARKERGGSRIAEQREPASGGAMRGRSTNRPRMERRIRGAAREPQAWQPKGLSAHGAVDLKHFENLRTDDLSMIVLNGSRPSSAPGVQADADEA